MKAIPFEERYRQDFIRFNTDWIVSNFGFLEEHDKETFEKIDEEMEAGAAALTSCFSLIFMRKNILGTVGKYPEFF